MATTIGIHPPPKGSQSPVEIKFPDGGRADIGPWWTILAETVRWLSDKGKLTGPVQGQYAIIVNTEPFSLEGKQITNAAEINGWFLSKRGNAPMIVNRAKRVIEQAGEDASEFKVRFT